MTRKKEEHEAEAEARAYWKRELAAAGPRAASISQRETFAEAIISLLGTARADGARSENAYTTTRSFLSAEWAVRTALFILRDRIADDHVGARRMGMQLADLDIFSGPLLRYLDRVAESRENRPRRDGEDSPPRRGRKNRAAIEIATMLAGEYDRHFGRPPGRGKQSDANNPFYRVCKIVEKVLSAAGYNNISIGDDSRREGINRACTAAVKDMLGMGELDVYVAADPRAALLDKRKERGENPTISPLNHL